MKTLILTLALSFSANSIAATCGYKKLLDGYVRTELKIENGVEHARYRLKHDPSNKKYEIVMTKLENSMILQRNNIMPFSTNKNVGHKISETFTFEREDKNTFCLNDYREEVSAFFDGKSELFSTTTLDDHICEDLQDLINSCEHNKDLSSKYATLTKKARDSGYTQKNIGLDVYDRCVKFGFTLPSYFTNGVEILIPAKYREVEFQKWLDKQGDDSGSSNR